MKSGIAWTPDEIEVLKEACAEHGRDGIIVAARKIGRSKEGVRRRAMGLGLFPAKIAPDRWSNAEMATLRNHWRPWESPTVNARRLAPMIGRTINGILKMASMQGLEFNRDDEPANKPEAHGEACLAEGGFPSLVEIPGGGFLFNGGKVVWAYPAKVRAA